ncbi:MAG TPA: sulfide:quinone reductase, partial [Bacteroidales bacterium]|nr:sulfide:quinone reductase [Bacteroidales bacterium]
AGVQAAIQLQKSKKFDVTLISDRKFLYVFPISIWIPVHKTQPNDVQVPLENIRKRYPFNLVIDKVNQIVAAENNVICDQNTFSYDYLIIAFGAEKLPIQGIENTLSICGKPEMAVEIRNRLDELVKKGSGNIALGFGGNPKDKSAVRGGPGFELAFNIHNYLKKKGLRNNFELTFFAPMDEPGARMGKQALSMMDSMFSDYKIFKHFGKKIKVFEKNAVVFEDDSRLNSDLILFIPGLAGHSALKSSDLPLNDAGFVKINDHCQVPNFSNVFAIGDIAAIEGAEWIAKQGHIAELMGTNAAFNIMKIEKGSTKRKGYQAHLNIICVMDTGNGAAFVFRNGTKAFVIPLPVVGHWMKKAWG